jgi:hypothetical protein
VFAILSGGGGTNWMPVQQFCEQQRIPCILPSVDVIPDTGKDLYSMYYSPGVKLEAGILARFFKQNGLPQDKKNIIQVYSDSSGRIAAEELRDKLNKGGMSVSNHKYHMISPLTALENVTAEDDLVLWLRPDEISELAAELPSGPNAGRIFISAFLATPEDLALPVGWKQRTYFVSLFDDLGLQAEIARIRLEDWLERQGVTKGNRRLQADAYAAAYLFDDALAKIRKQESRRPAVPLSREHVLEMLENLVSKYNDSSRIIDEDSHIAYYGRMSLGPNQRIAVRGGSILGYVSADSNKLKVVGKHIVP